MVDVLTPQQRSFNMSRIKGKNTSPEMVVRRLLHARGYRYKLHVRNLLGCPDIVLPKHKALIFVHGCFWHLHNCRYGRVVPKTNAKFWRQKRNGNRERDRKNITKLRRQGWSVLTIWECSVSSVDRLAEQIEKFLQA
jgi:DNA mismatch endonuclease (patch repair protein)